MTAFTAPKHIGRGGKPKQKNSPSPKEICGEKATVTKRCLLPKGHPGAHDEDP